MSSLEEVFKNCNSNHVFKKCFDNLTRHTCLVMLEKPSDGFLCNESRETVINKDFAKFRCNGLIVVLIFDLVDHISIYSILHVTRATYPPSLTFYAVGELVKPDDYYTDLETICAPGIHYFLTLKAAQGYDYGSCSIDMDGIRYDDDGAVVCNYNLVQ